MEKISSILPGNSRITTMDSNEGQAARPGAPTLGRRAGSSAVAERANMSTAERAMQAHTQVMSKRLSSQDKADIVQKMTDGFFMKKDATRYIPVDTSAPEYQLSAVPTSVLDPSELAPANVEGAPQSFELDNELDADAPEVGRYLDVAV